MKRLLFFMFAVTLLVACDEKADDNSLSVSSDLLEFSSGGGTAEFQIISNTSWKIIVADDNPDVVLSETSGYGNATISVTLPSGKASERTTRLIVRTDDGSSLRNVVLKQHGIFGNDVVLQISNYANLLAFDGKAFSEDSLTILTNVPWQLRGPEWIEAYNGKEWVKLSMDRANISGATTMKAISDQDDTYNLKIRCASENPAEEDRTGTIILESSYTNDKAEQITVNQLGRLRVDANQVVKIANALGWTWKCGKDVATIKYIVGSEAYGNTITPQLMEKWPTAIPGNAYGVDDLKANTPYYIYAFGLDENGKGDTNRWRAVVVSTGSDINQPIASISALYYNEKGDIGILFEQNEYAVGFFIFVVPSTSNAASYNDGLMAWLFAKYMHDSSSGVSTMFSYPLYIVPYNYNGYMQFVTWAASKGSFELSGLITRYDTAKEWTSDARSYTPNSVPSYNSFPLEKLDEFKKSVILIKK